MFFFLFFHSALSVGSFGARCNSVAALFFLGCGLFPADIAQLGSRAASGVTRRARKEREIALINLTFFYFFKALLFYENKSGGNAPGGPALS